jgi:hypothetical protein
MPGSVPIVTPTNAYEASPCETLRSGGPSSLDAVGASSAQSLECRSTSGDAFEEPDV